MSAAILLSPRRLLRLAASDAMNVLRDPMLLLAAGMSLLPALVLALGRGPMDAAALAAFGIRELSRYIEPVALSLPASLVGWVTGFLLLEDRDEGTLLALDITPVGKSGFLAYRAGVTALIAAGITFYAWPLILPGIGVATVICLAVLVALNAVGFAVVLPAIARNKVEGLAVTKLTNMVALAPLLAAIPSPLRYVAGVLPPFWVGELLGLSDVAAMPGGVTAVLGLAVGTAAVLALFALFARRAG